MIDFVGSVEPTASLTYDSFSNSGFGSPITGASAGDSSGGEESLDFTLELGNLAPTSTLASFATP